MTSARRLREMADELDPGGDPLHVELTQENAWPDDPVLVRLTEVADELRNVADVLDGDDEQDTAA